MALAHAIPGDRCDVLSNCRRQCAETHEHTCAAYDRVRRRRQPRLGIDAEVRLYDVDHAAAKRNERFGNWAEDRDEAVGDVTYRAVPNTADALRGADVVVASTQPDPYRRVISSPASRSRLARSMRRS